jgi:hypothetical protein
MEAGNGIEPMFAALQAARIVIQSGFPGMPRQCATPGVYDVDTKCSYLTAHYCSGRESNSIRDSRERIPERVGNAGD